MTIEYDITAVGHAIVDVLAPSDDGFLSKHDLHKGSMTLIDTHRALSLSEAMNDSEMASGGSAGNTISGAASFGAKCAYVGKVAHDGLGEFFSKDLKKMGVEFRTPVLHDDPTPTGRCLINVTPDGQRTMATFLGAAALISPKDLDEEIIKASQITYLEGYLFDTPSGRETFAKAAQVARSSGRKTAITLSDGFVVNRWRDDLLAFIDRHIDLVFANETELLALFQTDDFFKALRYLRGKTELAFVTRGAEGSVVAKLDDIHTIAASPVDKVVDTTGAGDQYAAGVLFGLTQGLHVTVCGQLGSLAAAEVIGHYGPRSQVSLKALATEKGLI
ncbi:adenosine kinase [Asticcacaulis benevestitus]|uniref:Carbohydrate kinase n=1 Tax=Asticcacaulis benevestitus DSM 16100 = ATCC BAA-896 TaxID=1121022 RepID=V4RSI4_9CAUL|nr:adenosine kinase [Asticcacaulis benevestitus]ESQ94128.1 carbohydrate kinase [Asticcacaulis benevestitus DSM 16100 = ATCC BAA-896]